MKTMTAAIKAKKTLIAAGVDCEIVSLDRNMTKNGCSYGLAFSCSGAQRVELLRGKGKLSYGEMIGGGY